MSVIDILISFIHILSVVLVVAILARALMSWITPNDSSGITRLLLDITEPILRPIRGVVRPVGGIDFSPILAMVLIQLLSSVATQVLVNA